MWWPHTWMVWAVWHGTGRDLSWLHVCLWSSIEFEPVYVAIDVDSREPQVSCVSVVNSQLANEQISHQFAYFHHVLSRFCIVRVAFIHTPHVVPWFYFADLAEVPNIACFSDCGAWSHTWSYPQFQHWYLAVEAAGSEPLLHVGVYKLCHCPVVHPCPQNCCTPPPAGRRWTHWVHTCLFTWPDWDWLCMPAFICSPGYDN